MAVKCIVHIHITAELKAYWLSFLLEGSPCEGFTVVAFEVLFDAVK